MDRSGAKTEETEGIPTKPPTTEQEEWIVGASVGGGGGGGGGRRRVSFADVFVGVASHGGKFEVINQKETNPAKPSLSSAARSQGNKQKTEQACYSIAFPIDPCSPTRAWLKIVNDYAGKVAGLYELEGGGGPQRW